MNPLLTTVATEVAREFGSRLSVILGSTRGRPEDARARAIAMAVYAEVAPQRMSKTALGAQFDRERSTVSHALRRVAAWRAKEAGFAMRFRRVVRAVRGTS